MHVHLARYGAVREMGLNGIPRLEKAHIVNVKESTATGKCLKHFSRCHISAATDIIPSSRFIPSRSGQDLQASFSLLAEGGLSATTSRPKKRIPHGELHFQKSMELDLGEK